MKAARAEREAGWERFGNGGAENGEIQAYLGKIGQNVEGLGATVGLQVG